LSSVTGINIQLLGSNDQVTITGVSVPGDMFISAGGGADTFTLNTVAAGRISVSGTGADTVSVLQARTPGGLHIAVGQGSRLVSVTGSTSSDLAITAQNSYGDNTFFDLENDSVTDPFGGGLALFTGSGNDDIVFINVNVAFAMTVNLGAGINFVSATNLTCLF